MNAVDAVLFDLDGTLLDSAPDLAAALNAVRAQEGLEPLPVESISKHVSRGAVGMLLAGMPAADASRMEAWKAAFLEHYARNSFVDSRLYDGIGEVLDCLETHQVRWGIVTNKSERLTLPLLEAARLADRASCIVCGDTLARSKPDPEPVWHACELLGVAPARTLFVGDDVRDMQAGRAAGTLLAAVYYGYGSSELNEDVVRDSPRIHHPRDLIGVIGLGSFIRSRASNETGPLE